MIQKGLGKDRTRNMLRLKGKPRPFQDMTRARLDWSTVHKVWTVDNTKTLPGKGKDKKD